MDMELKELQEQLVAVKTELTKLHMVRDFLENAKEYEVQQATKDFGLRVHLMKRRC